jgi:hypothetical protein
MRGFLLILMGDAAGKPGSKTGFHRARFAAFYRTNASRPSVSLSSSASLERTALESGAGLSSGIYMPAFHSRLASSRASFASRARFLRMGIPSALIAEAFMRDAQVDGNWIHVEVHDDKWR